MPDLDSSNILYHQRRRNEERQMAFMAEHPLVRQAHLELSYLHDLAELMALRVGNTSGDPDAL